MVLICLTRCLDTLTHVWWFLSVQVCSYSFLQVDFLSNSWLQRTCNLFHARLAPSLRIYLYLFLLPVVKNVNLFVIYNPFHAAVLFLYFMKTENERFFNVLRGCRKRPASWSRLFVLFIYLFIYLFILCLKLTSI